MINVDLIAIKQRRITYTISISFVIQLLLLLLLYLHLQLDYFYQAQHQSQQHLYYIQGVSSFQAAALRQNGRYTYHLQQKFTSYRLQNMIFPFTSLFSSSYKSFDVHTQEQIHNQNILITGASSGLGRAIALQIASSVLPPNLLILSARSLSTLQEVQQECEAIAKSANPTTTIQVHVITADLSQPESVKSLAKEVMVLCSSKTNNSNTITGSQTLDILINNGGVSSRSSFIDTDIAVDQHVMQINFFAGVQLAKAMIQQHRVVQQETKVNDPHDRHERKQKRPRGRIIWISSVQGKIGIPNRSSYAASKFAVQGYCECIRSELIHPSTDILVQVVSPGYICTNLSKSAMTGTPGQLYNRMDPTTLDGEDPNVVAYKIIHNVIGRNVMDYMVAASLSTYIAICLKLLFPSLLQRILKKRYEKSIGAILEGTDIPHDKKIK